MKLIDADKLIEEMRKWYWDKEKQEAAKNDVSPMDLFTHLAITTVKKQPIAYNVGRVTEELKQQADKQRNDLELYEKIGAVHEASYVCGKALSYEHAIEIVKGGGRR